MCGSPKAPIPVASQNHVLRHPLYLNQTPCLGLAVSARCLASALHSDCCGLSSLALGREHYAQIDGDPIVEEEYRFPDRFESALQNAGAPVGETEWHRSDGGKHNTRYMREGSSANAYGNILLSHKDRQPLSEENAFAMQVHLGCLPLHPLRKCRSRTRSVPLTRGASCYMFPW